MVTHKRVERQKGKWITSEWQSRHKRRRYNI